MRQTRYDPAAAGGAAPPSAPVEVVCGSFLCRLRVWTEAEWAALPPRERPAFAAHAPGLGWVGAAPVAGLC